MYEDGPARNMDAPVSGRTQGFRETCLMARDQYAQDVEHHQQQLQDATEALAAAEAAIERLNMQAPKMLSSDYIGDGPPTRTM